MLAREGDWELRGKGGATSNAQAVPPGGSVASKYVGTGLWLGICGKPEIVRGRRPSQAVGMHEESQSGAKGREGKGVERFPS